MDQQQKIKIIVAFPRNQRYYGYYVNNNLTDKHLMKRDAFYLFLAKMVKAPQTAKIKEFIDLNFFFIVDIENNMATRLELSNQQDVQKLKESIRKIDGNRVKKELEREINKVKNDLYEQDVKKLQDSCLNSEE